MLLPELMDHEILPRLTQLDIWCLSLAHRALMWRVTQCLVPLAMRFEEARDIRSMLSSKTWPPALIEILRHPPYWGRSCFPLNGASISQLGFIGTGAINSLCDAFYTDTMRAKWLATLSEETACWYIEHLCKSWSKTRLFFIVAESGHVPCLSAAVIQGVPARSFDTAIGFAITANHESMVRHLLTLRPVGECSWEKATLAEWISNAAGASDAMLRLVANIIGVDNIPWPYVCVSRIERERVGRVFGLPDEKLFRLQRGVELANYNSYKSPSLWTFQIVTKK